MSRQKSSLLERFVLAVTLMALQFKVTIVNVDSRENYWRETLSINDALLKLLRFARDNPRSACTIELREVEPEQRTVPTLVTRLQPLDRKAAWKVRA